MPWRRCAARRWEREESACAEVKVETQISMENNRISLRIGLFLHECGRARLSAVPATRLKYLMARLKVVPSRSMFSSESAVRARAFLWRRKSHCKAPAPTAGWGAHQHPWVLRY